MKQTKQLSKNHSAGYIILKSMPEFAYVFNKNNELVLWNKNLETVLGYTEEELYGKNAFDFMEKSAREINDEYLKKIGLWERFQLWEDICLKKLMVNT